MTSRITSGPAPGAIWNWPTDSGARGKVLLFVLVALTYAAGSEIALALIERSGLQGVFFIPAGITVAFLLRLQRSVWWIVLAAAGIAEFTMDVLGGFNVAQALGFALANTAEPLVGAGIVVATCGVLDLARRRHVGWFTLGAVLGGPALGATILATADTMFGGDQYWIVFTQVWLGDAIGVIIVGSAILVWGSSRDRRSVFSLWGLLLVIGSAVLTVLVMSLSDLPIAFSVLIGVVLAGALFGTRAVAVTSLVIAITMAILLIVDPGVLIVGVDQRVALVLIKLQIGSFALAGLVIAAEAHERDLAVTRAAVASMEAKTLDQERSRQHQLAIEVQRGLLPDRLVDDPALQIAARYEAAEEMLEVGGDWYDTIQLRDGAVALVVGDIVGKGVDAMTSMGRLRTAVGALAVQNPEPGPLLEAVDEFVGGPDGTDYATVFCAILDAGRTRLTYASAGHPPALMVTADGVARWLEGAGSGPLYGDTTVKRSQGTVDVPPGAALLLFSDGLVERRGESLTRGLERLEELGTGLVGLDAETICDEVISALHHGDTWHDDVVLLVVKNSPHDRNTYDDHHPSDPLELSRIRASVREWLTSREIDEPVIDDVIIALGEATSNVVRHAYVDGNRGGMRVRITVADSSVDVAVSDQGTWRAPSPDGGGMGLGIIESIADDVDLSTTPDGTTLRFRIALGGSAEGTPISTS